MEFNEVIRRRYSCRSFDGKPVETEKIDAILEAARLAPTAKDLQPFRIYLAKSEEALARIDTIHLCRYGAPVVFIVTALKAEAYVYRGEKYDSSVEDATIVATHMMLAAENEGLGTCWINAFNPDTAESELALPEGEHVVMMLAAGYRAADAAPAPKHFERRSLEETVTVI